MEYPLDPNFRNKSGVWYEPMGNAGIMALIYPETASAQTQKRMGSTVLDPEGMALLAVDQGFGQLFCMLLDSGTHLEARASISKTGNVSEASLRKS